MKINKPNYKNGSIVNLMSSIKKSFGGKSIYAPLKDFDVSKIKKNVVLLIVDGLGYEYLQKHGKGSFLYENLKRKMTSVFPATTASAMTAYSTGVAPQQHGFTGWFMYLKEIGAVLAIFPFTVRAGGVKLTNTDIKYSDIFNVKSFFADLPAKSSVLLHDNYVDSDYSHLINKGAERIPYSDIDGFFRKIKSALNKKGDPTFLMAYWANFDYLCHEYGADSKEAQNHFKELDEKIKALAILLKNENATIIVSADHGQIETKEKNKIIILDDHPRFVETLAMPLSGEPRAVYCHVRPDKIKQFENYVKTKFKNCCEMHKSGDLIKKNYFGLFKPNAKLKDRIGDYVLLMKENYIMKDFVLGEKKHIYIGNHGGVSDEEMFVPLIVIE